MRKNGAAGALGRMGPMNFTPEQQSAIDAKNRELLVSAAAGSGKTAVLVRRILHLIRDEGYSIDRMLVVTYTRAAAAELRDRLETAMRDAALNDPAMARQAELVGQSQISTIHSYCQKVIREHFRFCRIDPQFRLGDERTLQGLYRDAMEETLDALYIRAKTENELAALLHKLPERQLTQVMEQVYAFLLSRPDPLGWLKEQTEKTWTLEGLENDPLAQVFLREGALMMEGVMRVWDESRRLSEESCFPEGLNKTIEADLDTLNTLSERMREGFSSMVAGLQQCRFVTIARVKPVTGDEVRIVDRYKALRQSYKDSIQSLKELLPIRLETAVDDMNAMVSALRGLYQAMETFHLTYQQKKIDASTLDFNDLEHFTLGVLSDPELKKLESARFDAVFVDEYQDVSAIQESILNGLKRPPEEDGRLPQLYFYVGDVKQSIYRFRQAEPGLFLHKLETFSAEETAEKRKIILNRNFRSREGVLDAVNRTFLHVMDRRVTEIDYDRSAMLYPGVPSENDPVTELHLCQIGKTKEAPRTEAEWIARDILDSVGRPVPGGVLHYRDIAILLPVSKGVADQVEAVLTAHQIPVYSDAGQSPLAGEESIQAVQLLMLLDNPRNDTALLSVMRSPLFDFGEQELAHIRLNAPDAPGFYDAVQFTVGLAGDALQERCRAVLTRLEEERFLFRHMSPQEYLWDALMRTGMYAHYGAQPGGRLRQANLRMLCLKLEEYFQLHQEGLSGFLDSIREREVGDGSSPTVVNPWEDVVRIMTIHKSKGLEFPTVYVMGLGTGLSRRRQTKTVSLHDRLGISLLYMNEEKRTKRQTLMQSGIQLCLGAEERAEKARLLYVAMTRPKNRLVMIGSSTSEKNALESTLENVLRKPFEINDLAAVRSASVYTDWLIQSLKPWDELNQQKGDEFSTSFLWETCGQPELFDNSTGFPHKSAPWRVVFHIPAEKTPQDMESVEASSTEMPDLENLWPSRQDAQLPSLGDPLSPLPEYEHLPLKLGVTALCRAMEQGQPRSVDEEEIETAESKRIPLTVQRPRLLSAIAQEPAFLTVPVENAGALRGTLTHKLLGLLPLDGLRAHPDELRAIIMEETASLVQRGVLTKDEAALIPIAHVEKFFRSSLGQRMLRSSTVCREWNFNLRIADPFDTIVQGVIDLCFLEDGGWVLADYKTDHVENVEELIPRYHRQLAMYRQALERATPYPVRECALYSLRLDQAVLVPEG